MGLAVTQNNLQAQAIYYSGIKLFWPQTINARSNQHYI